MAKTDATRLHAAVRLGRFRARFDLRLTPDGVKAVGGLVSAVLLSAAALAAARRPQVAPRLPRLP